MTRERPGPLHNVPTLTEVVAVPVPSAGLAATPVSEPPPGPVHEPVREPPVDPEPLPEREPPPVPEGEPAPPPLRAAAGAETPVDAEAGQRPGAFPFVSENELTERILADLQRQVEVVLEYRVREVLTPILTRAADTVVRDARNELSRSLRELVARSVAQELLRQRSP